MYKAFGIAVASVSLIAAVSLPQVFAQEHIVTPSPESNAAEQQHIEGSPGPVTHQVVVKAVVPLSDLWAQEIQQHSETFVSTDSWVGGEIIFGVTIKGLEQKLMAGDKVTAEIMRDGEKIDEVRAVTGDDGTATFPFVPRDAGEYQVQFVYDEHERKVPLAKNIYFNMTPEQAALWRD